jgi:hypothetical protein
MRTWLMVLVVAALVVGLAGPAQAQTPIKNPGTVVLGVSPDHAVITRYELGWFLGTATEPVQVADLGTGTPVAGELIKPLPSYPIGQTFTAKARAYAGTIASDWSVASNPFYRTPAPPSALVVR